MRLAFIAMCLTLTGGCGSPNVAGSSNRSARPSVPLPPVIIATEHGIVYTATLTASATCAFVLEPEARERTYPGSLRSNGTIDWSGPSLNPPSGHATISSGVVSDNALSFSIGVERDPQSDDFHGLWEEFGSGKVLNISGKGSGVVRGGEVTGTFDVIFALDDPLDPPQPEILFTAHYCKARDHQFRFVKQ
jgi:hypothetical protein